MKLHVQWDRPVQLKDASKDDMIYSLDLERIAKKAGVYIFGRRWGSHFEALYVGKAGNVRGRVKNHLNNLHLMQYLHNARAGKRIVLAGRLLTKPGQQLGKSMALTERALIRYFLSKGHDLVNKQGTKLRRHELESSGKHPKPFFPRLMYLEKAKGE